MSPISPSSLFFSPFLFRRGKVPYLSPLSFLFSEPLWQMLLFMLFSLLGKAVVVGSEEPKMEMESPKKTGRVTLTRTRMSLLQGVQKTLIYFFSKRLLIFFEKEEERKKIALFCHCELPKTFLHMSLTHSFLPPRKKRFLARHPSTTARRSIHPIHSPPSFLVLDSK